MMIRRLAKENNGSVLVEAMMVLPIVILISFSIMQIGLAFFVFSSMNITAQHVSREVAVGDVDDETGGTMKSCAALVGVSANGKKSAERIACDFLSNAPGDFSVSVTDGVVGNPASAGGRILVTIQVQMSTIVPVDVWQMFGGTENFGVAMSHVVE